MAKEALALNTRSAESDRIQDPMIIIDMFELLVRNPIINAIAFNIGCASARPPFRPTCRYVHPSLCGLLCKSTMTANMSDEGREHINTFRTQNSGCCLCRWYTFSRCLFTHSTMALFSYIHIYDFVVVVVVGVDAVLPVIFYLILSFSVHFA